MNAPLSRRTVLASAAGCAAWALTPYSSNSGAEEKAAPKSPNDRWRIGCIGMRIGTKLIWNPDTEQFTGARAANKLLRRDQRHGFEIG